jgi:hypothetical protein
MISNLKRGDKLRFRTFRINGDYKLEEDSGDSFRFVNESEESSLDSFMIRKSLLIFYYKRGFVDILQ